MKFNPVSLEDVKWKLYLKIPAFGHVDDHHTRNQPIQCPALPQNNYDLCNKFKSMIYEASMRKQFFNGLSSYLHISLSLPNLKLY